MKTLSYIFFGLISYQNVQANNSCDPGLLDLPENGKAWNYNQDIKKWELECEDNYAVEKVSVRDFHRCKSNGQWASPFKVVVKCDFMVEAIHEEIQKLTKMDEKITEMIDDVSEMTDELSDNLSMSNMTNEILCTYYDCSGFDLRNDDSKISIDDSNISIDDSNISIDDSNISIDDSKINIDGPISISENNRVGEIDEYFNNYEFSFEVKANQLSATRSALSLTVGPASPSGTQSLIYLSHYLSSNQYKILVSFYGGTSHSIVPSFQQYDKWHKFQFIQSTSDGINCVQQLKLNGEQIWDIQLSCPAPLQGEHGIWMSGDGWSALDGETKNFKFFTHEL